MKVFKILLISCFMLIAAQSFAFAGSGKAIVPHWYVNNVGTNFQSSHFFISNISNNDLIVKVTVYNKNGEIHTTGISYFNFQNADTEIGAGKTAYFQIYGIAGNQDTYGYAVIEWKNKDNEDNTVGLVAWADWQQNTEKRGFSIPVNNGIPF